MNKINTKSNTFVSHIDKRPLMHLMCDYIKKHLSQHPRYIPNYRKLNKFCFSKLEGPLNYITLKSFPTNGATLALAMIKK